MATSPFPFGFSPAAANAQSHVYSPIPSHHHPLPPPSPSYHYAAAYPPPPPGFVPAPMYAPTPVFPPPPFCFEAPPYSPHPSPLPFFGAPHWPPPAPELPLASHYPPTEAAAPPTSAPPAKHSSSSQDLHASPGHPIHYPFPASATFHYPPTESAEPPTAAPPTRGAPSNSATPESKMANGVVPAGRIAMEPFTVSHTAEDSPVLCTDECTDEKDAEKSSSVRSPASRMQSEDSAAALPDHTPLLMFQDSEVDAFQRHYLAQLPSSPTTNDKDTAVLSHSRLDSAPEVFGEMPTPGSGVFLADENEQNSEKLTHHGQNNQSVLDVLAQAKSQLETISEKLRYAIMQNSRETTLDCIKKKAASKPHLAREDINLNCPSHQAVLEPECVVGNEETEDCSNQLVQVFKSTPEQQRYAAEQHESRQAPKCFSMPIFSPERPNVGDIDQLLNCPCRASECRTWDEESQGDANLLWEKSVCQTATAHPILFFLWDPGDTKFQTLVLTATDATKRQRTYVYKFGLTQILAVQFGVRRHSISIFPWDPGATEFPFLFMTSAGATELHDTNVFKSAFTCSCETQTPKLLNFLVNLKKTIPWPSGKLQLITPFKLFMELLCAKPAVQVTQQLYHLEFLVMAELSLNVNKVDGQLTYKHKVSCCLQIVLACPYSVPACYSSLFSSAEAIHSARSLSAATTMCVTLVLSSDEIAEEGKDAADVYKIPEIQLPLRKTSHVCYPGGESILYSYKGLHVHKTQLVDCTSTATHVCYLVPAHTPPTQISTQACSNTELGELISRCLVYHQHQITNWTSAVDNVIRSFEYAYTLHFLFYQWEFFHQLCVQKNYSAKNLLPSPNYLQLLDLDIIFITFLPP